MGNGRAEPTSVRQRLTGPTSPDAPTHALATLRIGPARRIRLATDAQWQAIAPLFAGHRPIKHSARRVLDALLYLAKTGCQWRYLPDSFPPWQSVYDVLRRWIERGLLDGLLHRLRRLVRQRAGRAPSPSVAVIDSQSVKTSHVGGPRGFDGGTRVHGRKRHILTDTLGLLLAVIVHRADVNDSQRVPHLLDRAQGHVPRLEVIFADEGYAATPPGLVWRLYGWAFRLVRRLGRGFVLIPKRWVVERTFAWFGGYRRLSKDYEALPVVSAAMVQLSAIRLMSSRLR